MEGLLLGHVHILLKFVCYNFFFVILLPLLLSSLYSFYLCILIQLFCSMKEGFLFFHFLAFRLVWYQSIDKICCNFSSPILLIFVFHQHCWVFFFFFQLLWRLHLLKTWVILGHFQTNLPLMNLLVLTFFII